MAEEANTGPSKKDLKKLAKKAEKQDKKCQDNEVPAAETAMNAEESPNPTKKLKSPPESFGLMHGDSSSSTFKVALGSTTFQIPLKPKSSTNRSDCSFLSMPALVFPDDTSNVVFGGNSILRAMTMMLSNRPMDFLVDNWLEWEHEVLRGSSSKDLEAALQTLSESLGSGDGLHLVGSHVTAADLSIVSTLYKDMKDATLPPAVSKYMGYQTSTSAFHEAVKLLPTLKEPSMPQLNLSDPSLDRAMEAVFSQALQTAFPMLDVGEIVELCKTQKCSSIKHGDYQCNASMPLFGQIKSNPSKFASCSAKSPKDVAQLIINAIPKDDAVVDWSSLNINGPGFILCRFSSKFLQTWVNQMMDLGHVIKPTNLTTATCVVDFSSPNIAKEMHVGHLRSTIIGESVCRVLEFVGNNVVRMNHVGGKSKQNRTFQEKTIIFSYKFPVLTLLIDWGTQFGMLIQYLQEEFPNFADDPPNITDLTQFYKAAKSRFDEDEVFKKQAQLNVPLLQSGDPGCVRIWKLLCDISRKEFQKVYDRLGVSLDEYGESFYNSRIPGAIAEFEKAGLIQIQEGGAKCVFIEGMPVPLMLQKSDGGYGYDSTDMAALKYRIQEIGAKRIIVITDFSQGDHFKLCYSAAHKIGWTQTTGVKLEHIGFGTVQGEDGKRFKTRSGDTVRLVDLLDEAVIRMEDSLKERIADNKANISSEEIHKTACTLGYGAVKYFDLRRNPTTNYIFSYDRMLDTKGNTAIYLLYAYARLQSILAKAKADHGVDVMELTAKKVPIHIDHPSERNLAFALQQFADTIELTLGDLFPYHICDFLYNAAISVSDFVTQCKVLGSPEMNSRLLLCYATSMVMRQGFDLLGIGYVDSI